MSITETRTEPRAEARRTLPWRLLHVMVTRTLQAVPTIVAVIILNFLLLQLAPGDAATAIAAESGAATQEMMDALRQQFGLDLPVLHQLANYLWGLAHFDLGPSP